jgi:hypothetical protein
MDVWAQLLSSLLDFLRQMTGPRFSIIYDHMEAIKASRNRNSAGLCSSKDFVSMIGVLEEVKPLGNGRMVGDFGKFPTWKFAARSMVDYQIRKDPTVSTYGKRFQNPSIILEKLLRPTGIRWSEFEFFGRGLFACYTKSLQGPLACGIFRVESSPLDILWLHIFATFSTILEKTPAQNHSEYHLSLTFSYERNFSDFSPQKLDFFENEDSNLPQR